VRGSNGKTIAPRNPKTDIIFLIPTQDMSKPVIKAEPQPVSEGPVSEVNALYAKGAVLLAQYKAQVQLLEEQSAREEENKELQAEVDCLRQRFSTWRPR
jgi:hypothetical protein